MGKIIAISNQKGGVGKSTTAINLSSALSKQGFRLLIVDLDPQGNTTSGFGIDKTEVENSTYEVMMGECTAAEARIHLSRPKLDVIPSTINLSGAEIELIDYEKREYRLEKELNKLKDSYDYIFIDCPPSLSLLTVNALIAATSLIIPLQCEYYALEGLALLTHTIELIKTRLNPDLKVNGIVFTMFDSRVNLANQVIENVRNNIDEYVYKTVIPRNIRLAEAPSYGMPIDEYDPRSSGAEAYEKLAKEFIVREVM